MLRKKGKGLCFWSIKYMVEACIYVVFYCGQKTGFEIVRGCIIHPEIVCPV